MNKEIIIRPEAESDLLDAHKWYEDRSKGLGSDFLRSIEATIASIKRYPKMYPQVYKNVRRALIRRFPYGIFNIINQEKIVVIAAFHVRRDPKLLRERIK